MSQPKHCVYILRTVADPPCYYVGLTADLQERLAAHNAGVSPHTSQRRPWRVLVSIEFDAAPPAAQFERYLKTGSGREFARRHFRMTI